MPTILLADDNQIIRRRVRWFFERAGWTVVGEAGDGYEAIQKTRNVKPDLVLLNISMPRLDGFQALPEILNCSPSSKVLIFTLHDGKAFRQRAAQLGAHGFIVKLQPLDELLAEATRLLAKK